MTPGGVGKNFTPINYAEIWFRIKEDFSDIQQCVVRIEPPATAGRAGSISRLGQLGEGVKIVLAERDVARGGVLLQVVD